MPDFIPSFVIRELEGQRRTLRLSQRALPQGPLAFEVKQRNEITYYQGNPIATATILGTEEGTTSVNGTWKYKFIGRGGMASVDFEEITEVNTLVDTMESFTRSGALVEVTWGRLRRIGVIESFKQDWINTNDVSWTVSFKWTSSTAPVSLNWTVTRDPSAMSRSLTRRVQAVEDAVTPDFAMNPDVLEQINEAFSSVESAVTDLESAVTAQYDGIMSAGDSVQRSMSAITSVASRAYAAAVEIGETSIEDMVSFKSPEDFYEMLKSTALSPVAPALGFGEYLVSEVYKRTLAAEYKAMKRESDAVIAGMQQNQDEILGVYTARYGDDLRDVSFQFYGSNNQWREIMLYNGLNSAELEPGQVVYVPRGTTVVQS